MNLDYADWMDFQDYYGRKTNSLENVVYANGNSDEVWIPAFAGMTEFEIMAQRSTPSCHSRKGGNPDARSFTLREVIQKIHPIRVIQVYDWSRI